MPAPRGRPDVPEPRLLAFPPSVDTETARRILAHHGIRAREIRQSAVGSALRFVRHAGKPIPILRRGRETLSPSRPIADRLDALGEPEARLVPEDPREAAEVEALWKRWNGELGVFVAQWLYHHVLADRELALRLLTDGAPRWQAAIDRALFPLVAAAMRFALRELDADVAARALRSCQEAFDDLEARLADGRTFQVGDRYTLADVAFSACGAAALLSDRYAGALPRLDELPPDVQREVIRFRERPGGRYVLRMYEESKDVTPVRDDLLPAGFAIPRPSAWRTLVDSLKARLAAPLLLRAGFAVLRRLAPVARFGKTVIVSRHADVVEALERDGELSVAPTNGRKMAALHATFILGMDPSPRYRTEKSWLDRCVLRDDLPRIRAEVRREAEALLDAAAERGRIDAGSEYARVVAIRLVERYFGVPGPDPATLMRWMRSLFADLFLNLGDDAKIHARALAAARGLEAHVLERIAALRASPDPGTVLGRLVALGATEPDLDDDAIRRSISGVIVGAVDTTNKAFCQALDQLMKRPSAFERARGDARADRVEDVGAALFEALRFNPHNPIVVRHAPRALSLGKDPARGIPAGSTVYAATLSAMFDPAAFEEPARFRTDRAVPYLHFGGGMHRCYGAAINAVTLPELGLALLRRSGVRRAGGLRGRIRYDGPFPDRLEMRFKR
jgi:cytochrome P450